MLVKQRSWVIFAVQISLVVFCLVFAWLLRFDFSLPQRKVLIGAVPLLLLMRMAAISRCELLHGYWRYTGISDAQDIIKAVVLGSVGFVVAERGILGNRAFPISVYLLEAMLTTGADERQLLCRHDCVSECRTLSSCAACISSRLNAAVASRTSVT